MKISFMETPPVYDLHDTDSLAAKLVARYSYVTPQDTCIVNEAALTALCLYGRQDVTGIKRIGVATCMDGDGIVYVAEFFDASCLWMVVGNDEERESCGVHTSDHIDVPPGSSVRDVVMVAEYAPDGSRDKLIKALDELYLDVVNQPEAIRMDVAIKIIEREGIVPATADHFSIN